MRTIRTKVYKFDELTPDGQKKAIDNLADINVDFEWWEFLYEDAENIGLKITEFDLDRNRYAKGHLLESANIVARNIIENHGKDCETYKTAQSFLKEWDELVAKYSDGEDLERVSEENINKFDPLADELEEEFRKSILEDYSILLQHEYEYQTSDKAIIETIKANEYEFLPNGKIF